MWLGDREFFAGGDVESLKRGDVFFVYDVFGGEVYGSCSVDGGAEDGGLRGVLWICAGETKRPGTKTHSGEF